MSMTGHGHGSLSSDGLVVSIEIRTVNSRYAKVNVRCGETYQVLEPRIEELLRGKIRRGTIQVNVRIDHLVATGNYRVNQAVLHGYLDSLQEFTGGQPVAVEHLLGLPGVIVESSDQQRELDEDWPLVEQALIEALDHLNQMRRAEGESMEADLLKNCAAIEDDLRQVESRAPEVVQQYQARLLDKLNQMLNESGIEVDSSDVIKEVGLFADRSDISEEIVRLRTHVEQFRKVMRESVSQGRKLDFLTQEMFRETNTIGSKANDAVIAQRVVDMKTAIERIREMVQNIE